jgi:hypothetical protein
MPIALRRKIACRMVMAVRPQALARGTLEPF